MLIKRIIPCVLYSSGGLVKTIKFKSPTYIGDPINSLKLFNDKGVDELLFLDIDASKKNLLPNYKLINEIASECFMPLAYGGGVKDINTIENILKLGIEKVSLNNAFLKNEKLCEMASKEFGSSTIIGSVDIKKNFLGQYKVYDHVSKKITKKDPVDYVISLQNRGVGEIFINNVDKDGTMTGYDITLINKIANSIKIPIVPCGGASSLQDISNLFSNSNLTAVAAGSIFVYTGKFNAVLINFPSESVVNEIISTD